MQIIQLSFGKCLLNYFGNGSQFHLILIVNVQHWFKINLKLKSELLSLQFAYLLSTFAMQLYFCPLHTCILLYSSTFIVFWF